MTRNLTVEVTADTDLPADVIWSAVATPSSFATWVVGTREIRGADPTWPAAGSRLFHRWGLPACTVRDHSVVLASSPPNLLVMRAYARPFAVVLARLTLTPRPDGRVRVVLAEQIESGPAGIVPPLARAVQLWRNRRALATLLRIAPRYAGPVAPPPGRITGERG